MTWLHDRHVPVSELLGERLARLVSDRRLAARLGANARDLVVQRFTWRACAERCLTAYETQ